MNYKNKAIINYADSVICAAVSAVDFYNAHTVGLENETAKKLWLAAGICFGIGSLCSLATGVVYSTKHNLSQESDLEHTLKEE